MEISAFFENIEKYTQLFPEIFERMTKIERNQERILERLQTREIYCIDDIAALLDMSVESIRRKPWLMPNYGKSDVPGKIKKWMPETWKNWWKVTPEDRKKQWELMPDKVREKAMGINTAA